MFYQSSSEIQADALHTLYLMNPNYADTQSNMLFLNPPSSSHAQHFMGIPLPHDPSRPPPPLALPHHQQTPIPNNMWGLDMPQQTPRGRGLSLSLSARHDHEFRSLPRNCLSPRDSSSVIMGSKYLKVAQELLDQVVNVGKEPSPARKDKVKAASCREAAVSGIKTELTTAQRQEIQMKKSKLKSMLDEVEQRCKQYHQQMQMVVATFERAAGSGSARAYTHLALKTILKQFRCLKSTITAQIKELSKSLGEEESGIVESSSRLKLVDNELRQQRMNAWRPQRGLPERAVSVLRAWLFQHFLHPYPKDSDKQMLAKQTGLTRSQVSNWFINARVRLWKPMVEEMYLEETKNQAQNKPAPSPEISASTLTTTNQMEKTTTSPPQMDKYLPNGNGIEQQLQAGFQGSNFSLSLALQPTHQFLSHPNFHLGTRMESQGGARINDSLAYEILDFQNRKAFPPQLLPDFVS